MKRRLGIIGLTLILAVGLTACGDVSDKSKKSEKKDKEQTADKGNDNSKEKEEEGNYSPIVDENVEVPDSEYPYLIKVNRTQNCVTVYTLDKDDEYTVPERALICSAGGENLPTGKFQLGESVEWQMLPSGDFGRYVTRVVDDVFIRSVNYKAQSEDALDVDSYNCLGDKIDDKAIVLGEADAKWIAENCPEGTQVEIYDDDKEAGPLGKPLARLISDKITWDPTDASSENAWYVPVSFFGVKDRTVKMGETPDLLEGITAKDKYGKDLTASIKVYGEVNVNKEGEYKISYSCENSDGDEREVESIITVEGDKTGEQPEPTEEPQKTAEPAPTEEPKKTETPVQSEAPAATPTPKEQVSVAADNGTTTVTTITTTRELDYEPPVITIVARSAEVSSISNDYLYNRIRVTDVGSGVDGVYITVCRVPEDGSYIVIYEAFDREGNSSCVSETVYLR